jgi:hypothetical protein
MFFNTMSVHDATAEEIDANSVTVQGVAALAPSARGTTAKMEYFMMNRVWECERERKLLRCDEEQNEDSELKGTLLSFIHYSLLPFTVDRLEI